METLLTSDGAPDPDAISIRDEASLTSARERVRKVSGETHVDAAVGARAALVATELARNQLRHATRGLLAVRPLERPRLAEAGVHRGLEIIAADCGNGIADIRRALEGVARTSGSLGVGLVMVRENSLEVDFDVREGEGTCVRARIFERSAPRRREVGVYGRPFPGESVSGDHGYFWRCEDLLLAAVCDGLGHGPLARDAANAAIRALRLQTSTSPVELLESCHRAMGPTRGAVMAITRVDERASALETASVGNIAVQLAAHRRAHRFGASSAVLGARQPAMRVRSEMSMAESTDVVIMMTDGIKTQLSLDEEAELLREHPIVIAWEIVSRFGRSNDDALVLVAR